MKIGICNVPQCHQIHARHTETESLTSLFKYFPPVLPEAAPVLRRDGVSEYIDAKPFSQNRLNLAALDLSFGKVLVDIGDNRGHYLSVKEPLKSIFDDGKEHPGPINWTSTGRSLVPTKLKTRATCMNLDTSDSRDARESSAWLARASFLPPGGWSPVTTILTVLRQKQSAKTITAPYRCI